MSLTDPQREAVHTLWDELADFPASGTDDALLHLMGKLSGWLDAGDVVWVGAARLARGAAARRDAQRGWRGLVVRQMRQAPLIRSLSHRVQAEQDTDPGMTTRALVAGVGRLRVYRLHDGFVDMDAFRQTAHYRAFYQAAGITDRLFVGFPVNADTESFFLVDRCGTNQRFTAADAELVGYALRGLKWFQRELMLSHGLLLAGAPLSAAEHRIVRLLLTERSEKEIAAELGQSPKTTHKYITGILRKYGVSGRIGLMALWLGRRG
ncbi:response regulator containing a CheY-like receiver domain and an HTH DNA-binding domain [Opitutaceae bacterium TAV1]|nr:response regulator containing a CheY-like receiver domain and an HTH DNA-binding domain [Opitutaceae bacterium TAV1]